MIRLIALCVAVSPFGLVTVASGAELNGTLKKINETGSLAIGYRDASVPFSYLDGNQKPVGFSIDLCQRVFEEVKARLNRQDLKIQLNPVNSATRIPLVANGTIDIECGSTSNSLIRQQQVAFSVTTFVSQFKWIVRSNSGVNSAADLKGKAVVVTAGTNTSRFVNQMNTNEKLGMQILNGKDHPESMIYVDTGRAAAFMEDDILLAGLRATAKTPSDFKILDQGYPADPYALMFRKDDSEFKALVDKTLIGLMRSGEFEKLYVKWFESPLPPGGINLQFPMSDKLRDLIKEPSDKANG